MKIKLISAVLGTLLLSNIPQVSMAGKASTPSCSLTVHLCGTTSPNGNTVESVVARIYNGDDGNRIIAAQDAVIKKNNFSKLTCKHNSRCYLAVEPMSTVGQASTFGSYSCGNHVYVTATQKDPYNEFLYKWSKNACPSP